MAQLPAGKLHEAKPDGLARHCYVVGDDFDAFDLSRIVGCLANQKPFGTQPNGNTFEPVDLDVLILFDRDQFDRRSFDFDLV